VRRIVSRTAAAPAVLRTTTLTAVLAAILLLATSALAHPFVVGGGRVAVQSLATIELDLAHGCGVESAGRGPDTDEVALEVPAWLRIVDVPEPDGWRVTIEDATDAQLGAVVWSATTATEPAPRFALDVVVDGEAGETRYLRVSQRCGELVERWIGTPDAPAEQPAVRLRLEAADPERPAPPLPEPAADAGPEADPEDAPEAQPEESPGPAPAVDAGEASAQPEDTRTPETRSAPRTVTIALLVVVLATGALATAAARARAARAARRG
jgi:hypothetical protein